MVHRAGGLLRLWGTDLTAGPTAAVAAFQLFDFLAAGTFHPRRGQYLVTDALPAADTGSVSEALHLHAPSSTADGVASNAEARFFVSCDSLRHPGFPGVDYGAFFRACRAAGKVFDLETRTGTSFSLMDTPRCGAIGALSVAPTLFDAVSDMAHTLEFIHATACAASPGAEEPAQGLLATLSTLRFLAERLAPTVLRAGAP